MLARHSSINVLYFAVFRERIGKSEEAIELAEGATVKDAIDLLASKHDAIARLRGKFRIAVNEEFVEDDRVLADRDELALIPPVAGGAHHVQLLDEPLSVDRCVRAVAGEGMGGIVTFIGMVRKHSRGTIVDHLEYEAYGSMAVREMQKLVDEIEAELPGVRIAVEHRRGRLEIGDIAVAIAAAAPHRA